MAEDANVRSRPTRLFRRNDVVAAVCEICGKHPSFGMSLSHSHRRTKRRWNPNIQRVRALVQGSPRRVSVCTSCIRAGKITKVPIRQYTPDAS
jgi:large subunit ribosomal protein L28